MADKELCLCKHASYSQKIETLQDNRSVHAQLKELLDRLPVCRPF